MDTITYASVAALPAGIAEKNYRRIISEKVLRPLDLQYLVPRPYENR